MSQGTINPAGPRASVITPQPLVPFGVHSLKHPLFSRITDVTLSEEDPAFQEFLPHFINAIEQNHLATIDERVESCMNLEIHSLKKSSNIYEITFSLHHAGEVLKDEVVMKDLHLSALANRIISTVSFAIEAHRLQVLRNLPS